MFFFLHKMNIIGWHGICCGAKIAHQNNNSIKLLVFSPFSLKFPPNLSQSSLFRLFEWWVIVKVVAIHVGVVMHRYDVGISALFEEMKSYVRMPSLAGKVEGRYVPTSGAAWAVATVRAATATFSSACLVQGGLICLEQVLNTAEVPLQHEEV